MAARAADGPRIVRYFEPLLMALQDLDGSGRPDEVKELVAQRLHITDEEQAETIDSGAQRFSKEVDWARFYLARAGYVDASKRGVWSLTELGRVTGSMTRDEALRVFKQVRHQMEVDDVKSKLTALDAEAFADGIIPLDYVGYRGELLELLRKLPPAGFERLCQRLLREAGFQSVTVTGRSGDGGIDGYGVLEISPFVSFKVLFQCKRYTGSVSVSQVRDFRGAVVGRADKGILLTTGTFTTDARNEAIRDGVPPIELVDGEKLIEMFEDLQFGLIPRKAFDIDREFFAQFHDSVTPTN